MSNFKIYGQSERQTLPSFSKNKKKDNPELYQPSKGLIDAVNVAIALGQPLLLTGEPGTGKTQLANHIAWYFGLGDPLVFNAQTTSTASDLFYRYDALGHFQFSQNDKNTEGLSGQEVAGKFIRYEGLGKAIMLQEQKVVLIDEIDKAPRDLPNDVLAAIEALEFSVPQTGKTFKTKDEHRPIIIITSNSEKNLPDAFLRRVVYFHIDFPDANVLLRILEKKVDGVSSKNLENIIKHFEHIRNHRTIKLKKNPATAELIFWAMLLEKIGFDASKLDDVSSLSAGEKEQLFSTYSVLAKTKDDLGALRELLFGKRRGRRRNG